MGKGKMSQSPLIMMMLLSFQGCAPRGLLGLSQKGNGEEPSLSVFIPSSISCPNITSHWHPSGNLLLVQVQLVSLVH